MASLEKIDSLSALDDYLSKNDNSENFTYLSEIPKICKTEPCLLGIDEAGRGPVLGPMVYGISFCPISVSGILSSLESADSKSLTEQKRDEIFSKICVTDCVGWAVEVISPNTISNCMLGRTKISLNQISMDSAIGLVRKAAAAGVNIKEVYVDTVGPPEKYQQYLSKLFPDYSITVAKKADSTYPIVSTASICAKVARDHALQVWEFKEGIEASMQDFGSGYPGDPTTKKFLTEQLDCVFGYPTLMRFSWSTVQNILQESAYCVEWEDPEEDTKAKSTESITSYFSFKKDDHKVKKHKFFTDRCLANVTQL